MKTAQMFFEDSVGPSKKSNLIKSDFQRVRGVFSLSILFSVKWCCCIVLCCVVMCCVKRVNLPHDCSYHKKITLARFACLLLLLLFLLLLLLFVVVFASD